MDSQDPIKTLKNIFFKFSAVVDSINVLHDTHISRNEPIINQLSNTTHGLAELRKELVVNSDVNVDFAPNGCSESYNNWINWSQPYNAYNSIDLHLPKIREQSVSVETTELDADSALHTNGRRNNSLGDGKETMMTKPSTDYAELSYLICEKGSTFTHTQVGSWSQSKPTINLNALSAINSTKIRKQSASVETTVVDVVSAMHSGEINSCRNASIDPTASFPIKSSDTLGDSMHGIDYAFNHNERGWSSCSNAGTETTLTNYLYYMLPDVSPNESDKAKQQESHQHKEKPIFTDQMFEWDLVARDSNGYNNFEVSASSDVDVDVDECVSDAATDGPDIEINANINSQKELEIDDDERMRLTELVISKTTTIRGCDNSSMFVRTSDDVSKKKYCCPYCKKLYSKLPEHMERKT
ncbi:hypothetical protein Bhyg_12283 [Pseudolycoriella hygida]|uniref:Uncharacterized protein n=1 Tax=Pseudolycoriella hygida TaxID=35572 RepID=A0A9Q0MZA1_9DIPT|nr:hypothetical protein Bhyg_12283 [Pseudolycoriella hygida]